MGQRDHYDLICAGGELGTYLLAALASKRGYRTLLALERQDLQTVGSGSGFEFNLDSHACNVFPGFQEKGAPFRVLSELDLWNQVMVKDRFARTQVVSPYYRVVVWDTPDDFRKEITREVGGVESSEDQTLERLYLSGSELPEQIFDLESEAQQNPTALRRWRAFWGDSYKYFAGAPPTPLSQISGKSPAFYNEILRAIAVSSGFVSAAGIGVEEAFRRLALTLSQGERWVPAGLGMSQLKRALIENVSRNGGKVRFGVRADQVIVEKKRIAGLVFSGYEGVVSAPRVVLGSNLKRLYATLPSGLQAQAVARSIDRVQENAWLFSIAVEVDRDSIPVGVTPNMIVFSGARGEGEWFEERLVQVRIDPASNGVSSERSRILVTTRVPYKASNLSYAYLRRLGAKMLRTLAEVIPFFDEGSIRAMTPDIRKDDVELRRAYPFAGRQWVPDELLSYYVRGDRQVQRFSALSWRTNVSGLYFCGRRIWPSLGHYGEAVLAEKILADLET